jgi:hypothetical protein
MSTRKHVCAAKSDDKVCIANLRNVGGSPEDWLVAINEVREEYQNEYGGPGTYTEIEWSADLSSEAQKWANEIAAKCVNGVPGSGSNPNDYGVATILNMKNPQMAVERWVMNGLNANTIPSNSANPFTQMIWTASEYVGCAGATSSLSGKSCTASVCYYAYAGNCGWGRYADWEDAVISGNRCSTKCPSDGTCTDPNASL